MSDNEADRENEGSQDLSNPDVTTKYHCAADIVNAALAKVAELCVSGADICEICRKGDAIIEEDAGKIFNKKEKSKKVEKGIAFPTCISVNELCGHFCPLEEESKTLQSGDVVKIDLGCHLDGYICVGAHTVLVDEQKGVISKKTDVIKAAWVAAEAALRMMKIGNSSTSVTRVIEKAVSQFKCHTIAGSFSYQMKRHLIEGSKGIPNRENPEEKVEEFEFKANEVYGLNIVVSSGEGKVKETEYRTTVFKRAIETNYSLKTALGRKFINEINKRFPYLPFTIRAIESQNAWRVGVAEATRHGLITPYPIMAERHGDYIAHFKSTVLLLPGGTKKITGIPFNQSEIRSNYEVEDEALKKLLASSANPKKKKKKVAKAVAKEAAADEENDVEMMENV